jgi:hypothetical protein
LTQALGVYAPESNVALLKAPAVRAAEPYRTPVAPSAPLQAQTHVRTPQVWACGPRCCAANRKGTPVRPIIFRT